MSDCAKNCKGCESGNPEEQGCLSPSAQPTGSIAEHWRVEVSTRGEQIVAIEPGMLAGKDLTPDDEATIRACARALLAFIGD